LKFSVIAFLCTVAMASGGGPDAQSAKQPIAIKSITLSDNPMRARESVTGTVVTTLNVASVTAQAGTFRVSVPKVSPGKFQTTVQVPRLFWWSWRGNVAVRAIGSDGASVEQDVPIEVKW
jgi:hypothetical protein